MPHNAAELEKDPYLRMLILGSKGVGKSTTCITSAVSTWGPGYVAACGNAESMIPAARRTKKFQYDLVKDEDDMEAALKEARTGVKEGRYKWVIIDDFTMYADWLEAACRDTSASRNKSGEPDGRKYWKEFCDRLCNTARRACDWRCHVIFIMHWMEVGGEIEGQRPKSGQGIVPLVSGAAREKLPLVFNDVLFMEKEAEKGKEERRVFRVNPTGVWGPVSRSVDGTHTIEADFAAYMKLAEGNVGAATSKGSKR